MGALWCLAQASTGSGQTVKTYDWSVRGRTGGIQKPQLNPDVETDCLPGEFKT
jgi:hypothetical protein